MSFGCRRLSSLLIVRVVAALVLLVAIQVTVSLHHLLLPTLHCKGQSVIRSINKQFASVSIRECVNKFTVILGLHAQFKQSADSTNEETNGREPTLEGLNVFLDRYVDVDAGRLATPSSSPTAEAGTGESVEVAAASAVSEYEVGPVGWVGSWDSCGKSAEANQSSAAISWTLPLRRDSTNSRYLCRFMQYPRVCSSS